MVSLDNNQRTYSRINWEKPVSHLIQSLQQEHKSLTPQLEHLCLTADLVGEAPVIRVLGQLEQDIRFLTRHLILFAEAQDSALYPVIQRLLGTPEATATMYRDQIAIAELITELQELTLELRAVGACNHVLATDLRRVLYSLYALITLHFAKEEELYLPLVEQGLSETEADVLLSFVERATYDAKHHPSH
jgi:iron-sulfur cluster repair protein YtfE (RIC family)